MEESDRALLLCERRQWIRTAVQRNTISLYSVIAIAGDCATRASQPVRVVRDVVPTQSNCSGGSDDPVIRTALEHRVFNVRTRSGISHAKARGSVKAKARISYHCHRSGRALDTVRAILFKAAVVDERVDCAPGIGQTNPVVQVFRDD